MRWKNRIALFSSAHSIALSSDSIATRRDAATPDFWRRWFSMSYEMQRGNATKKSLRFHAVLHKLSWNNSLWCHVQVYPATSSELEWQSSRHIARVMAALHPGSGLVAEVPAESVSGMLHHLCPLRDYRRDTDLPVLELSIHAESNASVRWFPRMDDIHERAEFALPYPCGKFRIVIYLSEIFVQHWPWHWQSLPSDALPSCRKRSVRAT